MAYRLLHLTDRTNEISGERLALFLGLASVISLAVFFLPLGVFGPIFVGSAVGLLWIVALVLGQGLIARVRGRSIPSEMMNRLAVESSASILTDASGVCLAGNRQADCFHGWMIGKPLGHGLSSFVAEPNDVVGQLARGAINRGSAIKTISKGSHNRQLHVQRLGKNRLLWSLRETIIDANLAVLTFGSEGLMMNHAAEKLFGTAPQSLEDIIRDLPIRSFGTHQRFD